MTEAPSKAPRPKTITLGARISMSDSVTQKSLLSTLAVSMAHSFSIYTELLAGLDSGLGASDTAGRKKGTAPALVEKPFFEGGFQ